MPSFKSKVLSACAWAAPVLAAVLPNHGPEVARPDGKLLQLDLQQNYAQATFSVPCIGCLGHDHTDQNDESLTLSFTSHGQEEACGSSNITLNGVYLPQEWNGDFAFGSGSFSGVTDLQQNEWFLQRDLDLEWNSACLHGPKETDEAAQVLTVDIKAIDGKLLDKPSGFTISFKQQTSPPSLLRLEPVPHPSASNQEVANSWREPPQHLRLVLSNSTGEAQATESTTHSLEDDIRELEALQAKAQELHQAIIDKKKYIKSQFRLQAHSFTDELNQCDSIACIVKTIAHKAHGAWRIVYVHFQHNHHRHNPQNMGRPEEAFAQSHGHVSQISGGHLKIESPAARPYEGPTNELPPRPPKPSPYLLALEITLGILCCGCLVAIVRHKCSSLRTRTERAAAREERLNARAYRRAARKHAWRNWWRGNWARRDHERIVDYEEKRALIQEQESVLEDAMQEEIRQLRAAHDVVNDLVRDAEEGRVIAHAPCNCQHQQPQHRAPYSPLSTASTYPPTSLPEIPSRPLSRTDSLPSYHSESPTEPPNYESDVDMSAIVANGFRQYTSSTTSEVSSHWTPDSSVIDVSPRPSADTLRYPQSLLTCDEDELDDD
ncbi:Nn.00g029700.m01.CDS01 [Neocucurbitaria sp. VM-36]